MRTWVGAAAAIFSISVSVSAREVKVGGSTISVAAPTGYCEVDKTNKADVGWLTSVSNLLNASGVTLIAAFPDCKELKKMRASGEFITTKVYVATETQSVGNASAQLAIDTCKDLKESGDKLTADSKSETEQNVKKFSTNSLDDNKFLGVLEDKGDTCSTAQFLKVKTSKGKDVKFLNVFATAAVRKDLIFLYSYTPYVDATSIQTGLANLKVIYSDFMAANAN